MLIDASHQEETRVVVTRDNRVEEFDFESEHKKQLKGNIYLAKITRVEPSLQAAFVEYGGNRHGFLAFSEIHPDYYQIPVADRLALLEAEEQAVIQEDENSDTTTLIAETEKQLLSTLNQQRIESGACKNRKTIAIGPADLTDLVSEPATGNDHRNCLTFDMVDGEEMIEFVGAGDVLEDIPILRVTRRHYRIQEVIKRRQILLVQVIKEERGNKGVALTTYLSLAGRYSVLMPNTARGGGISRKITNTGDRKRLREIVKDLAVPKGMGVILRTAGANRTKAEVKRDYEYLMRLWESVRNLTLRSIAPVLVYEEGSLIKRSIRDLYNKDIDQILVAGDKGYREAKDFMRMLIPSHAKVVQPYRDTLPIFAYNGIEAQLDRMLQPEVSLQSGGYLIINQTEALVAVDVNSGRSTKEHSIEETATRTNLEAAEEIARQLRLRDLAGLIVIDFIDMLEKRNVRAVEQRLKECLKEDRARIQVGRISHFGLMEMSRQRIRTSVLESTTQPCLHCSGTGYIRSESSVALHAIRSIEEYLQHNNTHNIIVQTPVRTALYVLNNKRKALANLEERFGLTIDIKADDTIGSEHLVISKGSVTRKTSINDSLPLSKEKSLSEKTVNLIEEPTAQILEKTHEQHCHGHRGEGVHENVERPPEEKKDKIHILNRPHGEEDRRRRRRRGRRGGRRNHDNIVLSEIDQKSAELADLSTAESSKNPDIILVEKEPGVSAAKQQIVSQAKKEDKENKPAALEEAAQRNKKQEQRTKNTPKKTITLEMIMPMTEEQEIQEQVPPHDRKKTTVDENDLRVATSTVKQSAEKTCILSRKDTIFDEVKTQSDSKEFVDLSGSSLGQASVTSLTENTAKETGKAEKRAGWWQRKGFF